MNGTRPKCANGVDVQLRRIALVTFKTIARMLARELHHEVVSGNLRQHRSRGYRGAIAVGLGAHGNRQSTGVTFEPVMCSIEQNHRAVTCNCLSHALLFKQRSKGSAR